LTIFQFHISHFRGPKGVYIIGFHYNKKHCGDIISTLPYGVQVRLELTSNPGSPVRPGKPGVPLTPGTPGMPYSKQTRDRHNPHGTDIPPFKRATFYVGNHGTPR